MTFRGCSSYYRASVTAQALDQAPTPALAYIGVKVGLTANLGRSLTGSLSQLMAKEDA